VRGAKRRSMQEARLNATWISDIWGTLLLQAICKFIGLWQLVDSMPPLLTDEDSSLGD
jgi:hypothetical protein